MYALIMAGGSGTRFWPKSRHSFPKQLIPIGGTDTTLIQLTVKRILPLINMDNIFIVTNALHRDEIEKQLPDISKDNIICEPVGRNTAPCIGLGAMIIREKDPYGIMLVLSADHFIKDETAFLNAVKTGASYLQNKDCLITIGIKPTYPETGYGYIKVGQCLGDLMGSKIFKVKQFTEKPDYERACTFTNSNEYLWNCGTFIWRADTVLKKIDKFLPALSKGLKDIEAARGSTYYNNVVEAVFKSIEPISVDYGILENDDSVVTIPSDPGWSDLGTWNALYDLLNKDKDGNVLIGDNILIDTKNSLIESGKRVTAVVGLSDFIVVDTDDALLICPKSRAQEVKDIVRLLKEKGMDRYI